MQGVRALVVLRYVLIALLLFSLLGISFAFGQYSMQGLVVQEVEKAGKPDVKTFTKAVCTSDGGVKTCEDKLIMIIEGNEYVAKRAEVRGKAVFFDSR